MKRKYFANNKLLLLMIISMFSNCTGHINDDAVIDRYHLVAVDVKEDLDLSYKLEDNESYVGVVGETVFAIGNNDKFIIVKQHPKNDKSIINYYIVPIYKKYTLFPEKGVLGPLSKNQFEEERSKLSIRNLKFTRVYKDLE